MRMIALVMLLMFSSLAVHSGDFIFGTQTCPTSGTKQVSTTSTNFFQLTVVAYLNNTGNITIGGPTVASSANTGILPGSSFNFTKPSPGINPVTLYMACTVNTDSIWWVGSR